MRLRDFVPHPSSASNDTGLDSVLTDDEGKFVFESVKEGTYSITGGSDAELVVLIDSVQVPAAGSDDDVVHLPAATLKPTSTLSYGGRNDWVHDTAELYVAAIGLGCFAAVNKDGRFSLDRLPEGTIRLQLIDSSGKALSNPVLIETTAGRVDSVDSLVSFYTLSTPVVPSAGGTVTRSNDVKYYRGGDTVRLSAHANDGYRFGGWGGDTASGDTTLLVIVQRNLSIGANFVKQYNLIISGSSFGSVNPSGTMTVDSGASMQISAAPNTGFPFVAWRVVTGSVIIEDSSSSTTSVRLVQGDASVAGVFKTIRTFAKTFGGVGNDWGTSVQQTSDGGYIIAGTTSSFSADGGFVSVDLPESSGPGGGDAYVIKTDSSGNVSWVKIFGGASYFGSSAQQTADGGYIVSGVAYSISDGNYYVYLIKLNKSGTILWFNKYGVADPKMGYSVQQAGDGGYIVVGTTADLKNGNQDVYLVKTDASGTAQWNRTYGGAQNEVGISVQQTSDGGYSIVGTSYSYSDYMTSEVYLIKTDAAGDTIWTKTYGGVDGNEGKSVQQTSDGGYIITGSTVSSSVLTSDVYLIKADASGNVQWNRTFGGLDRDCGYCVRQTKDGGYIITGSTESTDSDDYDAYLIKTDASGAAQWTRTFGGPQRDCGNSVQQTRDGGYVVVGFTHSIGAGNQDVYFIKTDANGEVAK
jgi:hypothetical protein